MGTQHFLIPSGPPIAEVAAQRERTFHFLSHAASVVSSQHATSATTKQAGDVPPSDEGSFHPTLGPPMVCPT
eukprot:4700326-Amphidinium_carterae.1